MNCVISLTNKDEVIEIVTEIDEKIVKKLNDYCEEENISSDDLVHLLIENFLEPECF